ncbi:MAG TPA: hypothetical protein VNN10_10530 [Dehalococcoidia bacterium]|nr:hypothetical protein [Dehalococcoidia bacterium]
MATVNRRAEWRAELRRLLLTDELLTLPEVVRGLADQVAGLGLVAAHRRTDERLGRLEGRDLERWYRERASSVFHRILARARLVDHSELAPLLDAAVEAGTITEEERAEILLADVVIRGRREQREAYAVAEVSVVVDAEPVRRVLTRARLLERATGRLVVPVVAGERVAAGVAEEARAAGVWRLLDGRAEMEPPSA